MKVVKAGTENMNQKQASTKLNSEVEQQIHPSVKFDPRQESGESAAQEERDSRSKATPKTVEAAPSVDSTKGGL